jgi:hypothetical protein
MAMEKAGKKGSLKGMHQEKGCLPKSIALIGMQTSGYQ